MTRHALLLLGLIACTSAFAQPPSSASDIAYSREGHVDTGLITEVAEWIHAH